MRRIHPWVQQQGGFSILEVLVAVGIMVIVVAGAAKLMVSSGQSQMALDARTQLKAEAGLLSQQLTRSFRERNNPRGYRGDLGNGGSSIAISRTMTTDYATNAVSRFVTSCIAVPAKYGLAAPDLATLANMSTPLCNAGTACTPCFSCPVGQMPVVTFSDTGTGGQRSYPAQGGGQGKNQKPIAGGLCIQVLGGSMAGQGDLIATISMAVIAPDRPVTVIQSSATLSSTIADGDVSIIH